MPAAGTDYVARPAGARGLLKLNYARADTIRPDALMSAGLSLVTNGVPRDLGGRRGWGGH